MRCARIIGQPLYQRQSESQSIFDKYFMHYHFHKNFYTNYHALKKLFYSFIKSEAPQFLFVYDIACGPYTATLSLLRFFQNENKLKKQNFFMNFCDRGDFTLEKLYREINPADKKLIFPVPLKQEYKKFQPNEWKISINQCCYEYRYGCKNLCAIEMQNKTVENRLVGDFNNRNSVNLIFCSYPGISYGKKFLNCVDHIVNNFSPSQKKIPTYLIYSHYTGKDRVKEDIQETKLKVRLIADNDNEAVPFSSYYYLIFRIEAY
jgi:hypothetical protein